MSGCTFVEPWRGECGKPVAQTDPPRCMDHDKQCRECGEPATTSCDLHIGGLMCGSPICDRCDCPNDHQALL